jgi:hypothetical protein
MDPVPRTGRPPADPRLRDRDWLYRQYVTERKSTGKIAREIGVGKTMVCEALKRLSIPPRTLR